MTQFYSTSVNTPRDPGTAATLSLVPGLGQLYNGESRKGILFLDVAFINMALLVVMAFTGTFTKALSDLGQNTHMKLNGGLLTTLQQIQLGTPASIVILSLFAAFVAFSVRDAYEHANKRRRRALYGDSVIDLTEATSGSYIFHISLLLSLAIMAMFFAIPKPAPQQLTEIEFLQQQVIKPPQKTPRHTPHRSEKNAEAHGQKIKVSSNTSTVKPVPSKNSTKSQPSKTSEKTSETSKAQPTPSQQPASSAAPPNPVPILKPPAASQTSSAASAAKPMFLPRPTVPTRTVVPIPNAIPSSFLPKLALNNPVPISPSPAQIAGVNTSMPAPAMAKANAPAALPTLAPVAITAPSSNFATAMPMPGAAKSLMGGPNGLSSPSVHTGPIAGGNNSSSLPSIAPGSGGGPRGFSQQVGGPVSATSTSGTNGIGGPSTGTPSPKVITGRPGSNGVNGTGDKGNSVTPSRSNGSGTRSGPVIVPTSGPAGGISPDTGGGEIDPRKNIDFLRNQKEAIGNPDFTRYMQELQRRIKRAWFPVRSDLSNRVVVMFKIHRSGAASDISIRRSSGIARHDNAALSAVQNAAPFPPLPEFSPESVEIEFTFDYNVFSGGR